MSVELIRQADGRITVRDPVRKEKQQLLAQVPAAQSERVRRLLELEQATASGSVTSGKSIVPPERS